MRNAVTIAAVSSSGEYRRRPSAFTPSRAARARRRLCAQIASDPRDSISSSALRSAATMVTAGVKAVSFLA